MVPEIAAGERLAPIFEMLVSMVGASRDSFNRHSLPELNRLQELKKLILTEIGNLSQQVREALEAKSAAERVPGLRRQSILVHLQVMADNLGDLSGSVEKKIKGGVLFSDKAVTQANQLFDQLAGLLRSLLDILKTDNAFLKEYVANTGRQLIQSTHEFATEHEARLIEGVCLPQAAPIFLALLDRLRTIAQHVVDVAQIMAVKP
ncbi:MAG: hypothetical protein FJ128_08395 [Deltaproteobacteria bacterium]|nr:hypothetical protein [Deltaproteobacteria bacterium]